LLTAGDLNGHFEPGRPAANPLADSVGQEVMVTSKLVLLVSLLSCFAVALPAPAQVALYDGKVIH